MRNQKKKNKQTKKQSYMMMWRVIPRHINFGTSYTYVIIFKLKIYLVQHANIQKN